MGCLCVKNAKPEVDDTRPAKHREGGVLLTGYIKCAELDSGTHNPAFSSKDPYESELKPQSRDTERRLQQADKGGALQHHQEAERGEQDKGVCLQNHQDGKHPVHGTQLLQYEEPWSEHEQNRETGEQLHHLKTARTVEQTRYSHEEKLQPRACHEKEVEPQQKLELFQERRGDGPHQRQVKIVDFGHVGDTTSSSSRPPDTKRYSDSVLRHLDHSISFRSFTPLEIQHHNTHAGWVEWIPHKGKVYDGNRFKSHFAQYVQGRSRRERRRNQDIAWGDDDGNKTEHATFLFNMRHSLRHIPPITSPEVWKHNGVQVLMYHGLSEEEIRREVSPFQMGYIRGTEGSAYWDSVRSDVAGLIKDISREAEQTPAVRHYFELLQRWQTKYSNTNPPHLHLPPHTDLNQLPFPLTSDSARLRIWLLPRQPSELKSTDDNTGDVQTAQGNDPESRLSRVKETFLQADSGFVDFNFDIEGEAAWELLPVGVVLNEVMTREQEATEEARNFRKDFQDHERMRRRREELGQYFIHKRNISSDILKSSLGWADLMERNRLALQQLC